MDEEAARSAIRQLMARYNVAGDSGRIGEVVATFTSEGILATPLWRAQGAADLAAKLASGASLGERRPRFVRHNITTSAISVHEEGTTAAARSYFLVLTDVGLDHSGVYIDRFRKIDDRWLIDQREVRIDWKAEGSFFEKQRVGQPVAVSD